MIELIRELWWTAFTVTAYLVGTAFMVIVWTMVYEYIKGENRNG